MKKQTRRTKVSAIKTYYLCLKFDPLNLKEKGVEKYYEILSTAFAANKQVGVDTKKNKLIVGEKEYELHWLRKQKNDCRKVH